MGGKVDSSVNRGGSPPVFKLHGQNYHLIGSLLPCEGSKPKFAQLYIYDTENEISNRISVARQRNETDEIHSEIICDLKSMLDDNNVLVKSFRMAKEKMMQERRLDVRLRLIGRRGGDARRYKLPSTSEVAALIVGDFDESLGDRDILVETQTGKLQRINELNASYLGLQYPLLFPYGEDGYREDISLSSSKSSAGGRKNVSMREFFAYRLHDRNCDSSTILCSKRLFQQFVVDAYTMIESARLTYIKMHQKQLRCEIYKGLHEALLRGETDASRQGKRIILPSSFTGGARYMIQNYQDAMSICKWAGYPDLFITFTCNPKWPEIVRFVEAKGLKTEDRPDIVSRIFKAKLDGLIKDLRKNSIFGDVQAVIYTVEFQKRGLPHAHILLFLHKKDKFPGAEEVNDIISAEIPDEKEDPIYYAAVRDFMIHGPCGVVRKNSPCMSDGRCTKHFPKKFVDVTSVDEDGYPVYRRRDNGRTVQKNGVDLDNRYVVPHNHYLLIRYGAHMNVEWCNQSRAIKYLFKYINKGHDRVTASFYQSGDDENSVFSDLEQIENVLDRPTINQSMFLAWFEANKKYPEARELTYAQFPMKFVWKQDAREWVPRKRGFSIGRIFFVPPGCGDLYYLRCLLNVSRGAKCYDDISFVNGVQYQSFRDACYGLGLLNDDSEYIDGIVETSQWASAQSLRVLFATLLSSDCISRPDSVWESCWTYLSDDILYRQRNLLKHHELQLNEDEIKNYALVEIEKLLRGCGKSLRDFQSMPFPGDQYFQSSRNRLVQDELCYDRRSLSEQYEHLLKNLNYEQRHVHDTVMVSVDSNKGGMFFVYGYGGTGKTFVWKTLSAALRSKGEIVLNVASSGIASLLLPGGRTAHSRFAIPFNPNEESTCNIKQGSPLAELIVKSKLIIWDEAPMMHKFCFESLDRSMRDLMRFVNPSNFQLPFGGKTIVFGGDFRQILPVIPKGSRQDIVHATINSSYLWRHCKVLRLTKNMRLNLACDEGAEIKRFSDWIANIGDGKIKEPNDGYANIDIPDEMLLKVCNDPIATIVESTYPLFGTMISDTTYFQQRAILAPTLDVVQSINEYMTSLNNSEGRLYLSSDSACHSDKNVDILHDVHTPEFLNGIRCSGVPNHELNLKVGTPVMLLRNIDHSLGLCNGTRLIITRLGNHVLEGQILTGSNAGHIVLIPRMSLTPSDPRLPFKFQRRQFPLIVSYAMTINKSQGQSLSHVGLFLKKPVFSHGQLYVALSRVTSPKGLKLLICDADGNQENSTTNVVFKEVFHNL
ncbi:uncharacterized protein [Henckelia pumila]|uniref:uncharacterized protein n=1 Tax=Henckelia pumila TaxID=405737 RepID=UPI003C6E4757